MDGTTISTNDVVQAVRESAMLADVTISTWTASKSDRAASDKLTADAGASSRAARVTINLLAGADENLKNIQSAFNAVRSLHYSLTLPWVSDPHAVKQTGARLLPHLLFDRYLQSLTRQKREAMLLLESWDVDADIARAKPNLGTLTRADYPSADEIKRSFRVHIDFEPLPEGAAFKGLPDLAVERLSFALETRQKRMVETAQAAMWREVKTRVGHIVERLSDPDATFRAATLENTRELLTLLPGWSLIGNPAVDTVIADIHQMLDGVQAKDVRDNNNIRSDVADKARRLVAKLDSFGV
jgi:hypothetical protein